MPKSKSNTISCNGCYANITYTERELDLLGLDGIVHKNKWMILAPDAHSTSLYFCPICGKTRLLLNKY